MNPEEIRQRLQDIRLEALETVVTLDPMAAAHFDAAIAAMDMAAAQLDLAQMHQARALAALS